MRRDRFVHWLGLGAGLALASLGRAAGSGPERVPPAWPLDAPQVLTSSFGEYRANHLHAGIDLGTAGRTGVPCRAVGDGSVVRMRMSPFGYGKALYIQLEDGTLTVYGHLSRFAPALAARARAEQKRLQRYTFDMQIPPGTVPVRRGEIVAWSGQTGVGVPHLHFEMRHGDVAINPQTAGFPVVDSIPPVIEEVAATPLDFRSHVEGQWGTRAAPVGGTSMPLRVAGRIGFSTRAWDAATNRSYRVGPYRCELRIDGVTVFRSTQARFDYADNHLAVLEYDQERLVERGERVQLLYLRPGDRLPGREVEHGREGVLFAPLAAGSGEETALAPGPHAIEVEIEDAAGHVTVRRVQVVAAPSFDTTAWPAPQAEFTGTDEAVLRVAAPPLWRGRFVQFDIEADRPVELYATMAATPGAASGVARVGKQRYRAAVGTVWAQGRIDFGARPLPPVLHVELRAHAVAAGAASRVADLDPAVTLEIPSGALLEDVAVRIERVPAPRLAPGPELFAAGPCVLVEPRAAALDAPVRIVLRDAGATRADRVGLFWVNRGGELRLLSATRDSTHALHGTAGFLSYFGAFADTTPPRIGALRVVAQGKAPQRLVFTVRDAGARLGDDGIAATLDGAFAIAEWDPETGAVVVEPETKLTRGSHRLEVVATDQLGNRARRGLRFQVP